LADLAQQNGRFNIAFVSAFLRHDLDTCIELLLKTNRVPEAAFFARTYRPSKMSGIVKQWKESLKETRPLISEALVDPEEFPEYFPGLTEGLAREEEVLSSLRELVSAGDYVSSPVKAAAPVSMLDFPRT
jgi:coatomer subunit beta'